MPKPSPEADSQTQAGSYDKTCLFDEVAAGGNKAEQDIAFALEAINSGMVGERKLNAALAKWSIHGGVPLAEHLKSTAVLSDDQINQLKKRAAATIRESVHQTAGDSRRPTSGDSVVTTALDRIDGSGKVAKLLGVRVTAVAGEEDVRQSNARYQLIRKLGQGGLGRVWLARDMNLHRHVALKEIANPAVATDVALQRFQYEAEITGRLEHPGIVPVYQLGEDVETGRSFYTMRFLGKGTLQDAIAEYHERREEGDDDPMLLRHLLTAFVNICHAIGHAHSRQVIHRDLKPENIVIDSFGQVIVIDWGLAKVLDEAAVEQIGSPSMSSVGGSTREGQVLGTPLYMAPEQAAGRLDEVDTRTDIYGLGAILFAITTGVPPHEKLQTKSVDRGAGVRGLISEIVSEPTPLAIDVDANVDAVLSAVCAKAMARRRYARYQSASDLAEDVQRWMAGEPVTAYEETTWQSARRWVRRNQRISQALA
ncbi:MAG: serine/threonine-protein kinase, partial [Planctomycetota bacterium]